MSVSADGLVDGSAERPLISVVLPMRNESRGLARLFERLVPVLEKIGPYEMVAIDDGSTDDTLSRLKQLRRTYPRLKVVSLSRNFGKEIAVTAGLARTSGACVVIMDSDLQHIPEGIPALMEPWTREGFGIVYARRVGLDRGGALRSTLSATFYKLFDFMSEVKIDRETGDFLLLDRRVVDAFLAMPERNRFNRGLLAWAGFRTTTIPLEVEARHAGTSNFGFLRLARLAVTAITAFGTLPLRVWSYIGMLFSLVGLFYGAFIVVRTLIFGADVPGYPSIIVAVLVSAGVQLIGLGIIGEYLGHVYSEVKRRPLYLVQETLGFSDSPADPTVVDDPETPLAPDLGGGE
ncbi:MAG: glycosyltransferase family 2 protein [Ancalomicrobiaceae bacterium]|nr:glycosyltransferase family 2 protein [Ancalomicrobiaceae bacterium]